ASRSLPSAMISLPESIQELSDTFGLRNLKSPFMNSGIVQGLRVSTFKVVPRSPNKRTTLGDILEPIEDVPDEYFVRDADLPKWKKAKGGKRTPRVNRFTGETYEFKEGAIPF